MKNLLLASALAVSLLAFSPGESKAFWNMPQSSAGYGWLGGRAINVCPGIHFHGPLYNYGPCYSGPGYQYQYVQNPICGSYIPADPSVYYGLNYQGPNTWGYVNPGIAGSPGRLPAYYGGYYGQQGRRTLLHNRNTASGPVPTSAPYPAQPSEAPSRADVGCELRLFVRQLSQDC